MYLINLIFSLQEKKLRLAVLDYLRRFCPGDNDTYRVVSSHFAMYREIAQLLEESALKKLNEINLNTARSPGTRSKPNISDCLDKFCWPTNILDKITSSFSVKGLEILFLSNHDTKHPSSYRWNLSFVPLNCTFVCHMDFICLALHQFDVLILPYHMLFVPISIMQLKCQS